MFASFSEFKFFQSFRVPVEEADNIRFLAEIEDDKGDTTYIEDARLVDVSASGLGFSTVQRLSIGQDLRISLQFKKLQLDLSAKVVRSFTHSVKDSTIIYGVELEEDDEVKKFLEQYIYGFNPERLRDCLVQLALTDRYASSTEGFEMFSLLVSLYKDMINFGTKEDFLETTLEEVCRLMNAQRGSLFLINPETNELEAVSALGLDRKVLKFDYRKGIAGSVFTTGVALNIDTINDSSRFSAEMDDVTGFKTKSIICNPIHNREDKIIGVVEVINKRNEDRFSVDDEKIMKVVSLVFSSVFHNYNPISEMSQVRRFSAPVDREHIFIGRTKEALGLRANMVRLKDLDTPLYIHGESGTGKSLFAKILHFEGKRGLNPFFELMCGGQEVNYLERSIFGDEHNQSKLESCVAGTVYLHEVHFLPLGMQKRLIDALIERRLPSSKISLDVRVIASSTRNLEKMVLEGNFNKELYNYLNVNYVMMDPLRKKLDDVKDLVNHFLKMECRRQGFLLKVFSPAVMTTFQEYDWPGNVKELKTCIDRAVTTNPKSHVISNISNLGMNISSSSRVSGKLFDDIPFASDSGIVLKDRLALIERQIIMAEIKRNNGNKSRAAREMGISREALRKKLMISQDILDALEGYKVQKKAA
jgi:two-component system response regulator HydG